jgi:large subunit ribosomal protein L6
LSRIGKKPVVIPKDVNVSINGKTVKVKGPKGQLEDTFSNNVSFEMKNNELVVSRQDDIKQNVALHGLTRALIQNMVTGVTEGYKKTLEIFGVGYKAELKGKNLFINIGYSHPILFIPPDGITIEAPAPTQIIISGINKQLVGAVTAKIRSFRKPEPYKGKGIKYSDEHIKRKAGKTAGK